MPVAAVAMAMTVETKKAAAEPARDRAAIGPAIGAGYRRHARTAVERARLDRLRDGAERGTSHQGQHDAARAFHDAALPGRQ
jgi:hypothetical protein